MSHSPRYYQEQEWARVANELNPESARNAILRACLMSLLDGTPTEAVLLQSIRVLVARHDELVGEVTRLLLEKPLVPMQIGGHVFTPPGWDLQA